MLRFQQEKVLSGVLDPDCAYQPPWTDKHFYLLDGLDRRQILVDESGCPQKFVETDQETRAYLRPTAGALTRDNINKIPNYRATNTEVPIKFKNPVYKHDKRTCNALEWREREKQQLANPMIINPEWEVAVRKLPLNLQETLYPNTAKESERLEKEQVKEQGPSKSTNALIAQIPVELWELIISDLDGITFLGLVDAVTDLGVRQLIWDALQANVAAKKIRSFWRKTCIQEMPSCTEIITSYSNCILETERNSTYRREYDVSFYDATLDHDSQDVVEAAHTCVYKLVYGDLTVKRMTALEDRIKANLQLNYQILQKGRKKFELVSTGGWNLMDLVELPEVEEMDDSMPRTYAPHKLFVETIGSICYYVLNPRHGMDLVIMEDLEKCEERRMTIACENKHKRSGHEILYIKIMNFPRYKQRTLSEDAGNDNNSLPEIDRVIFTMCKKCYTFRSIDGRTGFCYTHEVAEEVEACADMEPILAFHEEAYVLWHSPMPVEFNQLKQVRKRFDRDRLLTLNVNNGSNYWNLLRNYTQHFIPVLKKMRNSGTSELDKKAVREFFGGAVADADYYYELRLVSMRLGTDSISVRNTYEMKPNTANYIGPVQPYFNVHHRNPQYYYNNALDCRSLLEVCYSGCVGHDLYVFWNHKALACSWGDGTTWMFHSWKKALSSLKKDVPSFADYDNLFVSQMTVCSKEVVAASINGHVVIFKARKTIPNNKEKPYPEEPSFIMEPMRLVKLDLMSQNLTMEQLTFTFDKGDPYFMILYRDKRSKCPLDFWISRLCFNAPDPDAIRSIPDLMNGEEESQIMPYMANPSTLLQKYSFAEAIAFTVIGCSLVNLKKRVGLTDNETKSYSQLVDEAISNPNNKELLDLIEHPSITYQAMELIEVLGQESEMCSEF